MFRHPILLAAKIGGNAQGKAFLAQQHVSAVAGIDGHNGVVLGELDDVPLLRVQICLGVEALDKIAVGAQSIQHVHPHPGHDGHGDDHVDGVRDLNAVLGKGRAHHTHGVGDHIHGPALHGTVIELV